MSYPIASKVSNYSLDDTLNYNYVLIQTAVECFTTYVDIITAFIVNFAGSKSIHTLFTPNKILYNYLLDKGISTLTHIFKFMLLYTKNLELTDHYCRQTIGYYVEFIEQNMRHNDNEKINYNNASRFSYSKTIDKLIKRYRKTSYNELDDNTSELLSFVERKENYVYSKICMMIDVYKKIVLVLDANAVGANAVLKQHILNLVAAEHDTGEKIEIVLEFINIFNDVSAITYIYRLCEVLRYKRLNKARIIKKLTSSEHIIRLSTDSVEAYIEWIIM